jgi:hypothetical protein
MLSGIFASRSIQRQPRGGGIGVYVLSRDALFIYLYLLWTLLQGMVKVVAGAVVNSPLSLSDLPLQLVFPRSQMWFFGFLIVMTTVVMPIQPWKSRSRAVMLVLVGGSGMIAWFANWPHCGVVGTQGLALVVFYAGGLALGEKRVVDCERSLPLWVLTICVMGSTFLFAWVAATRSLRPPFFVPATTSNSSAGVVWGIVAALSGSLAVLGWSSMIRRLPWGLWQPLAFTGRHSLEVFLAHIIAASGTRIILDKLGIASLVAQIACGIIMGTVAPLMLVMLTPRLRLGWLWEPPAFVRRLVEALSSSKPSAPMPT